MNLSRLLRPCFILVLSILFVFSMVACNPVDLQSAAPVSSSTGTSPTRIPAEPMPNPDILISPAQSGQFIKVAVGQVIGVANPGMAATWQVSYASEVLEILTPPENLHSPGPQGWLFRAIAPGQTDLLLTSMPQPCPGTTPCPPMSARFVFTIQVK